MKNNKAKYPSFYLFDKYHVYKPIIDDRKRKIYNLFHSSSEKFAQLEYFYRILNKEVSQYKKTFIESDDFTVAELDTIKIKALTESPTHNNRSRFYQFNLARNLKEILDIVLHSVPKNSSMTAFYKRHSEIKLEPNGDLRLRICLFEKRSPLTKNRF